MSMLTIDLKLNLSGEITVRFEAPPGITALTGPSGIGKTTTLLTIAGATPPKRGKIVLGDELWCETAAAIHLPMERRSVGMVFQSAALFPHLTVEENVMFGMLRSLPYHERRTRAQKWLTTFRADHLATRSAASLSGGESQRVAAARAFAREPRVLLLDEPFSALQRELREELASVTKDLVHASGQIAIYVTHDEAEAAKVGDGAVSLGL